MSERPPRTAFTLRMTAVYEDYDEEEWVEEEDESEDEDDVLVCPSCSQSVHEETQQCPHCGDWIVPVYPGAGLRRLGAIVVVLALLTAFVLVYVF